TATRPSTGKAMKLGTKGKNVESFVDQLKSEGEVIGSATATATQTKTKQQSQALPTVQKDEIHIKQEEKLTVRCGRDGGVENLEIHGMFMLRIKSEEHGRIFVAIQNNEARNIQLQTHPNIDKKLFVSDSVIGLKNPEKPFPANQEVGVLKWRYQSTDAKEIPLTINCWPNETSSGGCDVNIEYELQNTNLVLKDVIIYVPLPSGGQTPVIGRIDGDYSFDNRKTCLLWSLPVIDQSNSEGTLEFSVRGKTADFFPVKVEFVSETPFFDIKIAGVKSVDTRESVPYSSETSLVVEKYEYV
ncbi:unnamed protein product, partial [Didymodactylos carnosus]